MPVKVVMIRGAKVRTLEDVYRELGDQLPFPKHFGRNLDALWDILSTDIEGPFEVVWEHANRSRRTMGEDFEKVMALFKDLEKEREDFTLRVKA